MNFNNIDNIIFDIGDVLLEISKEAAYRAFENLGINDSRWRDSLLHESGFYYRYERGEISTKQFCESIQEMCKKPLSTMQIEQAWAAMLVVFPRQRINQLMRLREKYNTYILSNTNEIHIRYFNSMLRKQFGIRGLEELVQKAYYSNQLTMRKPEAKLYEYVIADSGIDPKRTLFVDDREENLEAAAKWGIQGYLFTGEKDFDEIFAQA